MPSTYSNLKIQLMSTGENDTTWGDVTNANLGTALEEAIAGSADVTFASGDVTLTLADTNGTQPARNMRLNLIGTTGGTTRNLNVPAIEKAYIINNTCANSVVVKTAAGTGVTVPAGKTMWVFVDGTNVVDVSTHLSSLTLGTALPVASGGTGSTSGNASALTGFNASNVSSGVLAVSFGGTGANAAPAARANLLPSYAGNAGRILALNALGTDTEWVSAGGAGTVTSVNANSSVSGLSFSGGPITSAGTLTLSGTLGVQGGGTGATSLTSGAVLIGAGTSAVTSVSPGTSGNVLTSNGSAWVSQAPAASGVSSFNSRTGAVTLLSSDVTNALGYTPASGTVTSVSGTGSVNGLSLSGTVTSSGSITLGGSITSVATTATISGVTIGFRNIPRSTTSGTATTADVGRCIAVSAGITIPNATFAAGDAISIYNDSPSAITITQGSSLTLRQGGTTNTGNRTLVARGMATVWFNSSSEAIITGAGVS
jgi:hypothetical protein